MDDATEVQTSILGQERGVAPERTYANIEHKPSFDAQYDSEKKPDSEAWRQFEEVAFKVLKEQGYIGVNEDGDIIVNPEMFTNFAFKAFRDSCSSANMDRSRFDIYGSNSVSAITNLFWDREVFIKGAEHYGKIPALAIPESRTQGLSEAYLRNSNAAIDLWNLGRSRMPEDYPTLVDGWDSALPTHDFVVGYLVLNNSYGAGRREELSPENEVLLVNYPDGSRRAISANFFHDWGYSGKPTSDGNLLISNSPHEFVLQNCQNLTTKGILYPEDFVRQADVAFGIGSRRVSERGIVWTESMAFTLGNEYAGKQVYRVSPDLAAVVAEDDDGKQFVEAVFELKNFKDPERNLVTHWAGRDNFRVKKEGVVIYAQDSLRKILEDSEDIKLWVDNLDQFLKLSDVLSGVEVDVSIFALKEQILLQEIFSTYDEKTLLEFADNYNVNGLRALVLSQDALGDVEALLQVGLDLNTFDAQEIFDEAAKISEQIYLLVGDGLASDDWAQEARKKAVTIMLAALPLAADEQVDYKPRHVVSELERLRNIELDITDEGYLRLLKNYAEAGTSSMQAFYLRRLVEHWKERGLKEKKQRRVFEQGKKEVVDFYASINDLEKKAQETTGSIKHLELAKNFVEQVVSEAGGREVNILDEGSGSGARITQPLAQQFPGVNFVGVDLRGDFVPGQENLQFEVGDFTSLDDPDNTYNGIYSVWSPWMDVEGMEGQIQAAIEAYRVLKTGGRIMIEAADLEGEGKSWQATAREYKRQNPEKSYGTIKTNVEGGVGERRFNIFPKEQLLAMFEFVGFSEVELVTYQTENNVPRIIVYAKKP